MRWFRKDTTKTSASWTERSSIRMLVVGAPLAAAALVLLGWLTAHAGEPAGPRPDDVGPFMRAKLAHAQDVLAGLALEDYDAIARAAQELSLASQASSWQVLQTAEYARQSGEFRRSCESLKTAAREKNLDAATLAWMEVTMKCVQCHRYEIGRAHV